MVYEAVYYSGEGDLGAYLLLDGVEGATPELALQLNVARLTQRVIDEFGLDNDASTHRHIQESLYVLRPDALVSIRTLEKMIG